jgi:hypothetical protein
MNQNPPNMPQCNNSYGNSWKNCMEGNNQKNDPEKKLYTAILDHCCKLEMQCNNPNVWFKNNNINAVCTPSPPINRPHFGDTIHDHKVNKTLSFGVY